MKYSESFKQAAVQKYLSRNNRPVMEIVDEIGISRTALYQWCNEFAIVGDMKKQSKPQNRRPNEKLKSIVEYDALPEAERGEYLRKYGLHEEHIAEWRKQIDAALSPSKSSSPDHLKLIAEQKKNKQLEKELLRKDRALAEASALLILKKKADMIWGSGEDE